MNGRIYDPLIGRFLSADTYVQSSYDLQAYNRYSYALNNPLKYTDPSGYITKEQKKQIRRAVKILRRDRRSAKPQSGTSVMNRLENADIKAVLLAAPIPLTGGSTAPGTARNDTSPPQAVFTVNSSDNDDQLARRMAEEAIHTGQIPATTPTERDANEVDAKVAVEEIMIAAGRPGITHSNASMVTYDLPVNGPNGTPLVDSNGNPIVHTVTVQESTQTPMSVTVNSRGVITNVEYTPNVQYITNRVGGDYNTTTTTTTTNPDGSTSTKTTTQPVEVDDTQTQPNEEELDPRLFR